MVLLLAFYLLLRLAFWLLAFPNPDEAYYWLWGQHPALSYYDHPPLLAWVQGSFTALLGQSFFTLRLPNLLANSALLYTYYRFVRYLYGADWRQAFGKVVLALLAAPLYFLFLALAWPDALMITAVLAACFWFVTFLDSYTTDGRGPTWRLYLAAAALGVGVLAKYNTAFVAVGFLAVLVSDRRFRPLLRDRRLYLAVAILLSALTPILLWNASNGFESFRYYLTRSADGGGASFKVGETLGFWLLSIVTVSPFHCVAWWRGWKTAIAAIRPDSAYPAVAFWVFATSTGLLSALSLVSTALYYWNINAYLLLFPLLPAIWQQKPNKGRLFWSSQVYGLLFAALLVIHYGLIPISALASPEGDPDTRMLYGWPGVGAAVQQAKQALGPETFLLTTDYRSAAALAYQLNQRDVTVISPRIDQFDFWYQPEKLRGRNGLILSDDWHPVTPEVLAQFERTEARQVVPATRFGIWIKNYYLIRGYRFLGDGG